jgi:Protein of unknown function (DUF4058)
MPIHDWTRVSAGTWHDFHLAWIAKTWIALNDELLPESHYAQIEPLGPDEGEPTVVVDDHSLLPRTLFPFSSERIKWRTIVIRHTSGDRIVALLEIVSPGNKAAQHAINVFVEKAQEALFRGYHLLILDLFPPGPRDPNGIHAAIWGGFSDEPFVHRPRKPSYLALLLQASRASPHLAARDQAHSRGRCGQSLHRRGHSDYRPGQRFSATPSSHGSGVPGCELGPRAGRCGFRQ